MSAKKPAWTAPGPIDEAAEARKGTAAAHPVLSLAPDEAGPRKNGEGADNAQDKRSPAEIEADIEQTRDRLAVTLDELSDRLSPRAVLRKANTTARGAFVAPDGAVRKNRAALALGAVVSAVGGVLALRRLRHR